MRSRFSERVLEVGCFLSVLLVWLVFLWPLLSGRTTFPHDVYNWTFPLFHHFAAELIQGRLPLWNPYEHGGEPFYPLIIAFRFHDPVVLGSIFLGRLFTSDTVLLFHWSRIAQILCYLIGTYFLLRRLSSRLWVRCALIPILFFSSFSLSSFVQDGILNQFQWAPWAILAFLNLMNDNPKSRVWWGVLIFSVGIHLQSYHGVGVVCAVTFLSALYWRSLGKFSLSKISVGICIAVLFTAPSLFLLKEGDRFIYPMREVPTKYKEFLKRTPGNVVTEPTGESHSMGLLMNYDEVTFTGTFQKWSNYVQALSPRGNYLIHRAASDKTWGRPSEAFIYFGILPWVISLFGLAWTKHFEKNVWRGFAVVFSLLALGPVGGIHTIFFPLFPPLWILRHLEFLSLFGQLGMLAGVVYGLEAIACREFAFLPIRMNRIRVLSLSLVGTAAVIALSHWDKAGIREPVYSMLCLVFMPPILLALYFRKVLTRWDIFISGLLAQLFLLLVFSVGKFQDSLWIILAGILPIGMALYFRGARWTLSIVAGLVLVDLSFGFRQASLLYSTVSAPRSFISKSNASEWARGVAPQTPAAAERSYYPQYVSLLQRKRYAFSSPFRLSGADSEKTGLGEMRRAFRWHSYLLLKSYYQYIHSSVSDTQMATDFGLNVPLLRLVARRDGVIVDVKGDVSTLQATPGRLRVAVNTATDAALLFSDSVDPYWRAEVDGVERMIHTVSPQTKGVTLKAGKHEVNFHYEPKSFYWSMILYLLATFLSSGWIIISGVASFKRSSTSTPKYFQRFPKMPNPVCGLRWVGIE